MYFNTGPAKRVQPSAGSCPDDASPLPDSLAGIAKLGGLREETIVDIAKDAEGELIAILSQAEVAIWTAKPCVLICKIKRTHRSIHRHGLNVRVYWRGSAGLVVQTARSKLLYYSVQPLPNSVSIYQMPIKPNAGPNVEFVDGVGEGYALPALVLRPEGLLDLSQDEITACAASEENAVVAIASPPSLLTIPWSCFGKTSDARESDAIVRTAINSLDWLVSRNVLITSIEYCQALQNFALIASCGRVYNARETSKVTVRGIGSSAGRQTQSTLQWRGSCLYGNSDLAGPAGLNIVDGSSDTVDATPDIEPSAKACTTAINARLSLIAVGLVSGVVRLYTVSQVTLRSIPSHDNSLRHALRSTALHLETGATTALTWTSDGHALAVGWQYGFAIWSAYGKLTQWAVNGDVGSGDDDRSATFDDRYLDGVTHALWPQADFALWLVCPTPKQAKARAIDEQLYILPFARSAVAAIHTPDNTNHAFLQMEDRLLVYRGTDQPDMSVINPESDVWQSIKIPAVYLANYWPIQQACISQDARLLALAGRSGFCHYNALSVTGGMHWCGSTLIVACEMLSPVSFKVLCFSRDRPLNLSGVLHEETYPSPIVITSIFDNSLLVYTADNTLYHYLVDTSSRSKAILRLCGSIGFEGVVRDPSRVRGMSWMVPHSQQKFGVPADDLNVATLIFLIEGKLVLLRPRRAVQEEVKYDLQVLADRIEFYWTHLYGIGTLENSLWGWDGNCIKVWLNALTIDMPQSRNPLQASQGVGKSDNLVSVSESVSIPLDFYPLSVLMDKGIIIGVDHEMSLRRSLDFSIPRISTSTHLFLHHILLFHLKHSQIQEAVLFASFYQHLVYFAHALEILLHNVLEEEADALLASQKSSPVHQSSPVFTNGSPAFETPSSPFPASSLSKAVLPKVVEFLDHFDECLEVVVGCARKTEIARWKYLFDVVGQPRDLFEQCLSLRLLKVAASYLLVLHNLESSEKSGTDTVTLLRAGIEAQDWQLCKELLRFLYSLDASGMVLYKALFDAGALDGFQLPGTHIIRSTSAPVPRTRKISDERDADEDAALSPAFDRNLSPSRANNGSIFSIAQIGLGSFIQRAKTPVGQ